MLQRLAHNKSLLFWVLNAGGWIAYAVLNYLIGIEANNQPLDYMIPSSIYALGGMTICLALRLLYRAAWSMQPLSLFVVTGLAATIAAALFTGFRTLTFMLYYEPEFVSSLSFRDFFDLKDTFTNLYIIGTWSGLYFGIKFYRTVQQQNETLLKATSVANEAQLKMLRYQLNPHFLFNTLNSISTLVLEGENPSANHMVTRLSSFLRHSLDSDPMRKMTLEQEIETLKLYLDIEQIRFEERLRLEYDIDPDVMQALVPGLLLQPLIENSIKYAISVSEDGGTISIAAGIEDGKLCLRVADSGPGIENARGIKPGSGNGVGLRNTSDRLDVLYGPEYEFRFGNQDSGGLAVKICIPLEYNE